MDSSTIGRYELKEEIGRGGMATVFRAFDPHFQRDVALKIIPPEFLHDPTFKTRFQREAKTIAALDHPAIVPVYDFGEEKGQPFLVMRYLPGGSLTGQLEQGQLPFARTLQIITRIAPALDEAHQLGIIHRDLKPDNILFDQRADAFITDFGIAKLAEEQGSFTSGSLIIGTPAYMSPEQANGEELDGRSDIYALGIILFQMLTGQLPYHANTPIGLIMQHINQPVPDVLNLNADLPSDISQVIDKALAKEPDDRFNTAVELAVALSHAAKVPLPSANLTRPKKKSASSARDDKTATVETREEAPIVCPKCSSGNLPDARFCTACNKRLQVGCSICHTPNRIDALHCKKCGTNLKKLKSQQFKLQQIRKSSLAKRDQAFKEKAARQIRDKLQILFKELDNRRTRPEAKRHFDQLARSAVKILVEHLQSDTDVEGRCASAGFLAQLYNRPEIDPSLKPQIGQALVDAQNDSEPEVQFKAEKLIEQLAQRRSRENSGILKGLVDWIKGD